MLDPPPPAISIQEAFELLQKLQLYEEQQADGSKPLLHALRRYKQLLQERTTRLKTQVNIRRFFGAS
jgi:hypothetical protein